MTDISDAQYRHQLRLAEEAEFWFSELSRLRKIAAKAYLTNRIPDVQMAFKEALLTIEQSPFKIPDDFLIDEPNASEMLTCLADLKSAFQRMESAFISKRWGDVDEVASSIMASIEHEEEHRTPHYDVMTGDL